MSVLLFLRFLLFASTCIPDGIDAFCISPQPVRPSLPLKSSASSVTSSTSQPSTEAAEAEEVVSTTHDPSRVLLERIDQTILADLSPSSSYNPRNIHENIDREHNRDVRWAKDSSLPFESEMEDTNNDCQSHIEYESVKDASGNIDIAIRTKQSTPLLREDEIQLLRLASESFWNRPLDEDNDASQKSRFTYQRAGNSEAHLSDVVKYTQQSNNHDVSSLVNELLLNRIYPWIREAYLSKEEDGDHLDLYVYDSLFIRYNATEANANIPTVNGAADNKERKVGAGQPLHRDLGYVSVNIMLNPSEEFEGGGTFFENQLLPMIQAGDQPNELQPLKPLGQGHALAHYSNHRHAGAATHAGVRDILVIFLAATEKKQPQSIHTSMMRKAPRWELNARMKSTARTYCSECSGNSVHDQIKCRILHHRLAIDQMPNDGEAWHYLGMALMDYHDYLIHSANSVTDKADGNIGDNLSQGLHALELAVSSLNEAANHTPCDGRLYNNLGIVSERLLEHYNEKSIEGSASLGLIDKIQSAYRSSIMIQFICKQMGCDIGLDYECACLNFGLHLSKLDRFDDAVDVLSKIVPATSDTSAINEDGLDSEAFARQRIVTDATSLLTFCRRQVDNHSPI